MLGTILNKPVSADAFCEAMAFCCDSANNARIMEYKDRYEIAEKPREEPKKTGEEAEYVPELSVEERLDRIEKALSELQGGAKK